MIKRTQYPVYEFELFQDYKKVLSHAVLSRHINISDKKLLKEIIGSTHEPISFNEQMHGDDFVVITDANQKPLGGDILITRTPDIPLFIRVADCAGVLLFDPNKKVIANIHAGWKGTAKRAISKTIKTLHERFGVRPENLLAGMAPMIGPCCFEFTDPKKELPKFMHPYITEENHVNLWAAVEGQLRESGVLEKNIENPRICTSCNREEFFSYRREGSAGRFGALIMLR